MVIKLCPHGVLGISKCKECKKERKEAYNEYRRKWRDKNRNKVREDGRKQHRKNVRKEVEKHRIERIENPALCSKKDSAHNARRYGCCPLANACELCPEGDERTENLLRHHPDYDYPRIYVTVCPACHYWVDKAVIEVKNK